MKIKDSFGGVVLRTGFRLVVPFTYVYAIYVLLAGEISPGGGFQAGAVLAAGIILNRWISGSNARFNIKGSTALITAGIGAFIYALVGWIPVFMGGNFLDYSFLPIIWEDIPERHARGIFLIEVGVTIAVMMTILCIVDALTKREGEKKDD